MCVVSVIYDYYSKNPEKYIWDEEAAKAFKEAIEKLKFLDKKFGEPDCQDESKNKLSFS